MSFAANASTAAATGAGAGAAAGSGAAAASSFQPWFFAITSALQGVQSYGQARATEASGRYEASRFESNARLAELEAQDAIRRGKAATVAKAGQVKRAIGSQRASFAGQGVSVSSGTPLDIQAETAELGAMDIETIRNNAAREAWGYEVQAADYSGRGKFARLASKNEARQTLLTGGLSVAKEYARADTKNWEWKFWK